MLPGWIPAVGNQKLTAAIFPDTPSDSLSTGDASPEHVVTYVDWPKSRAPNKNEPERPKYRFVWLRIYVAGQNGSLLEKAALEVGQKRIDKQNLFVSPHWHQEVIRVGRYSAIDGYIVISTMAIAIIKKNGSAARAT